MRKLQEEIRRCVAAGVTGIWAQSYEPTDFIEEVSRLCLTMRMKETNEPWRLLLWDISEGLFRYCQVSKTAGGKTQAEWRFVRLPGDAAPEAALNVLSYSGDPRLAEGNEAEVESALANAPPTLLIMKNGHLPLPRFPGAQGGALVQRIYNQVMRGKPYNQVLIILTPTTQIPVELERSFSRLEHQLPDVDEIEQIVRNIATGENDLPTGEAMKILVDSCRGLTRNQIEEACSLQLTVKDFVPPLTPAAIWQVKRPMLKTTAGLEIYEGGEKFADIGGLAFLKKFALESLTTPQPKAKFRPRGLLLLGVPGTGKSLFAKALGNETGRKTIKLDFGAMMGSLVGQTETNTRAAFKALDMMENIIVFIDEIEKAMRGMSGTGQSDGGVSSRLLKSWLEWMNDHTNDAYVICTCNDIQTLMQQHPEFARAGRLDGMFFLDFPGRESKNEIWKLHLHGYELLAANGALNSIALPQDEGWTGAEIESACRLARLRGRPIAEIGKTLPTIASQAAENLEAVRTWASGRCWSADKEEIYDKESYRKRLAEAVPVFAAASRRDRRLTRDGNSGAN